MDDDISKGLGGLMGVLSPDQERVEQQKARNEVAKKLGLSHIPNPGEIAPDESDKAFTESIYKVPPLNIPKIDSEVKPYKAKKTGLDKNWSLDRSGLEKKYKLPVKKFDALDKSTYPSDPKQRLALAHGTATDQLNQHHKDRQGTLLSKESSRKTLQYISDTNTKYSDQRKANWLFNPVTGELEDTNDPKWLEKSEKKMNQFEDNIVDPKTGQAEPKIGTDAHKEKYPERYKTGYVSKSERIVSQLKDLKEFGKNKLIK